MELLKEYQVSIEMGDVPANDLTRQRDKFKGIIHKMPIKYLLNHEKELFRIFPDQKVKKEVVKIFIDSFTNRYDVKAAQILNEKYISVMKK